jgi:hypothetical protein
MAFSGLSTNPLFTANLEGEDISEIIATLAPYEAPLLNWLGDSDRFAALSPKHEFIEDYLRPRYIVASTAINSATAATGIQVNGLGEALTVGTLLENESAAPEIMQVTSIVAGGNSILVSRNFDGAGVGSLAAGQQLFVRVPTAEEGHEHGGLHTRRLGNRRANTVGYFNIEIAGSGTAIATASNQLGMDTYENARAKIFMEVPGLLETEVIRGVLNGSNSLGTTTAISGGRTMQGLRAQITSINSQIASASFSANPHLYIGNVWEQVYQAGASTSEEWGIVAGRTFFRDISNLNDTKVQDSNEKEKYKRVIREYEGPFGRTVVILGRSMPATELMLVPRARVRVVPLINRSFQYLEMGRSGDNTKGMVVGEYTVEAHHTAAMARLRGGG